MKRFRSLPAIAAAVITASLLLSASLKPAVSGSSISMQEDQKGLKDYFKDYFIMGVAVGPRDLSGPESDLIVRNFASITAENVMKPTPIHPEEKRYAWENADLLAEYAKTHGLKMRGHTLVWHNQSPAWFFKDDQGNAATKEIALAKLKEHITSVVRRYKGTVYAWDVVNEVIADGKDGFFRDTEWYRTCGSEYIAKAFQWAHEADPAAELYYNDYNTEDPVKREKIIRMIKGLIEVGVPIHGIGLQGHWSNFHPSEAELRKSIEEYSALGLKIQITELDVSVYPSGHKDADEDLFTPEREQKQIDQYKMIFRVLREYKNAITAVTFWNVSDQRSWLDNFPVRGRKNYPLLFGQDLKPKKAYLEVVKW
jgi:endo-1,4-beta-xylanase